MNLSEQFLLRPDVIFLNHGSFGACPRPVFAAYQRWQLQLEQQPVAFLEPSRGLSQWKAEARRALAAELGADADDLVGMSNATTALNVVAQSLDLRAGDEILTTDHEYGALEKTWAYVCRRSGAVLRVAPIPLPLVRAEDFTDAILDRITPRTRVLFLSHITSATAMRFPIEAAIAAARARGIITVIDGAHAPGHINLQLDALGADFYAGNCHKWLLSPKGAAFLHVRRSLQSNINPLVISHAWSPDPDAPGIYGNSGFIDRFEMQGTNDPAAWLAVPVALEFRREQDWPAHMAQSQKRAQQVAQRVQELTQIPALATPEFCAPQMVAMPVPVCDPALLKHRLYEDYQIEIPCFRWQDRTIVRISVQPYTSDAELDRFVLALQGCLPKGHT